MKGIDEESKRKVVDAIGEAIGGLDGVELVETKFYSEYGSFTVEALIWRKGGVDLNLCEEAHNAISAALDSIEELFDGAYVLKVSSMGLDRPIVTDDDFRRALDTEIEFKDGEGKKQRGILKAYDSDRVTLTVKNADKVFERKYITKVQPYIRF